MVVVLAEVAIFGLDAPPKLATNPAQVHLAKARTGTQSISSQLYLLGDASKQSVMMACWHMFILGRHSYQGGDQQSSRMGRL